MFRSNFAGFAIALNAIGACLTHATEPEAPPGVARHQSAPINAEDQARTARIAALIEELGHELYATRRRAAEQLKAIGVPALDQLQAAILHNDPQVAAAARFLVRSSFTNWTNENDPLPVRKLLEHYGTGDLAFRDDRIRRLAELGNRRGLTALLRIARFEIEGRLSRHAALLVLESFLAEKSQSSEAEWKSNWERVYAIASQGTNPACRWLTEMSSVEIQPVPFRPDFWVATVEQERRLLADRSPETSRDLVVALSRLVSEELLARAEPEKALEVASGLLAIEYRERERLPKSIDLCEWALARGFPKIVVQLCEQPWLKDVRHTRLDYLRAESHQRLGETELATEFADRAFHRGGLAALQPANYDQVYERMVQAEFLNKRQQYEWAEREYRAALDKADSHDRYTVILSEEFARMLADGLEYRRAADVMGPMVERFQEDPAFARDIDNEFNFNIQGASLDDGETVTFTQSFRARFLYYRAMATIAEGSLKDAKQDLRDALEAHPDDIDIAITMWKNRDDDAWNREGDLAVERSIARYRELLPRLERLLRMNGANESATFQARYSNSLNTFAWLLVCTQRDLQTAFDCSQQACHLAPNRAAYLDTLARCHFAMGRVSEAIRVQKEAYKLEPWSRELGRTLTEYRTALEKQEATKK